MKKKIYYWSPYLGNVATVRSVLNSMIGLKNLKKNEIDVTLLNCYGEWNDKLRNLKKNSINLLNLQTKFKFSINTHGFFISRFIYIFTFLISYQNLKKKLILNKPNYIIVHLLTFIPLLLFLRNKFKTKLIFRISGKPKLTLFRLLLWKISNKNIHLVFCPTKETIDYLKEKNIFDKKKIKFLPDPVLYEKEINDLKKQKIRKKFKENSYFLSIGRLTKQKNHELLIKMFKKYKIQENLLIIGNGELHANLKKLINDFELNKKIKIINYQKNIFYYIKKSKAVIIPSLWEDPGFVMIETAYCKKPIICSDCASGPREFIGKNKGGFLFESNSINSLKNAINNFKKTNKNLLFKKIKYASAKSKLYSIENHTKLIIKYLF